MRLSFVLVGLSLLVVGCGDNDSSQNPLCEFTTTQPSLSTIDCQVEFDVQAARPLDSSLPGAFTIKTILDQGSDDALYFLDTNQYPFHQTFAVDHLGWPPGQPFVSEYLYPQRRFLLGSVTYYAGPKAWTYELAPYDTASVEMIVKTVSALQKSTFFGGELKFHPTSLEQEAKVADLPPSIPTITTDELYEGIDYQPLNLAETVGQVRILTLEELETVYVSPREIAVLDRVPNDIAVVAGVVTEQFQTPLSHINVLSQQRKTPNMGLRDARTLFADYEGKWVKLTVGAFEWKAEVVTADEADAWWEDHKPPGIEISAPDTSWSEFRSVDDLSVADVPAVGGKAAQYGELRDIANINVRPGFVIPVVHYENFLAQNGFDVRIKDMLVNETFRNDGLMRKQMLQALQDDMKAAPVDPTFLSSLEAHLVGNFPATRMKFRSSTNAEDLNGFNGAGLYDSKAGEVGSLKDPVDAAVKDVWASLWNFRAFEEREYRSIDHEKVYMAVLVIPSYTDETANGVAITANPFDSEAGGEDAFYLNAQSGETSVVQPPDSGITADQLLYFFFHNNQPATYFTHSSLVAQGSTVLSRKEMFELGKALLAVREHFSDIYDPPEGYGRLPMDVEWKRQADGSIWIKQARPYPGRGSN